MNSPESSAGRQRKKQWYQLPRGGRTLLKNATTTVVITTTMTTNTKYNTNDNYTITPSSTNTTTNTKHGINCRRDVDNSEKQNCAAMMITATMMTTNTTAMTKLQQTTSTCILPGPDTKAVQQQNRRAHLASSMAETTRHRAVNARGALIMYDL